MGKRRDARLAKMLAEEVKSLAGTPMASTTATVIPGDQLAALEQTRMPVLAQALQRDAAAFGSQMGPNYPLIPYALDPLGPNGRPDPRKYQYDISENLQVSKQLAKWNTLKAVAEQCDVVARSITIRASEVAKMDKSWIVSDEAIAEVMNRDGTQTAQASATARDENAALIARLNDFWDNPYPQSDRGWREWITEAMWQILVYDGLAVHPQMNLGRQCIGLNIIDASTIKLLLNNYGDTPRPPDPAFQQILWGFPRGEFTSTPDKDGKTKSFVDASFSTNLRDQLSYYVMNRRTWTPYGFSPVEQAIPLANLYMEYQQMMLFEFKHGTSSDVYMETAGDEITLANLQGYERIYNDYAEGSSANRKKTRLLPAGFKPSFAPTVEERYKPEYIESILKRLAAIFGVSSQQLGVIPRAGMGGGKGAQEGDQDNAETVSSKPMMNFIEEFVNSLSRRYLGATKNVTFVLQDDKGGQDDVEIANAAKINVTSAIMTANEQRRELGMPDYEFEGADEPFIVAGNNVIYLRGAFSASQNPQGTQGQEGEEPEGQEGADSGQTTATPVVYKPALKSAEARAYRAFMRKGSSREFEFHHHTPEEAELLKAGLVPHPKPSLTKRKAEGHKSFYELSAIAHKHSTALHAAMLAGVGGVAQAISSAMKSSVDHVGFKRIADQAVAQNVTIDTSGASEVLGKIYQDTASLAAQIASDEAGTAMPSRTVSDLLAQRGITLKGISDSSMKRISTAISDGLANGDGHGAIAGAVNQAVFDIKRSDVIAITESNRSYNAAFVDQLAQNGYSQFEWLPDSDACEDCLALAGVHDITDPTPPEHPNCRCVAVLPQ